MSAQAAMPGTAGLAAVNPAIAALVVELRPMRVNAVSPGVIDTPWWNFLAADQKAAALADYAGKAPAGRVGTPEDVAQAIAFLVTHPFMTGHTLV